MRLSSPKTGPIWQSVGSLRELVRRWINQEWIDYQLYRFTTLSLVKSSVCSVLLYFCYNCGNSSLTDQKLQFVPQMG